MNHFNVCTKVKLPFKLVNQRAAFLGMSGTGKSYAATKLAEEMLEAGAQLNFIDPVGIGFGLRIGKNGSKKGGFDIYVFGGDHGDFAITSKMGGLVAETVVTSGISAVIDISDFTLGEQYEFLIAYSEALWKLKKKNRSPLHVFWEECHLFIPQERAAEPRAAILLNRIERLIRIGRQRGVGSSMISQFPQSIHKRCLNNAEVVFAFACSAKHERNAISDWFDSNVTADFDVKEALPSLETGECILASRRLLKVCTRVKIHEKKSFDSSDTPEFGGKAKSTPVLRAIDKEKLNLAFEAAFEEAKSNDPSLLKAEVDKLKQLVKQHELGHFMKGHAKDIAKSHEELYVKWAKHHLEPLKEKFEKLRAAKLKRINIQLGRETKKYEKASTQLDEAVKVASKALGHMVGDINHLRGLEAEYSQVVLNESVSYQMGHTKPHDQGVRAQPRNLDGTITEYVRSPSRIAGPMKVKMETTPVAGKPGRYTAKIVDVQPGDFKLVGKMQDMLDVLFHGPLSRDDLITAVGMAPGGGSNNYVYELMAAGLVEKGENNLRVLTQKGVALVKNKTYSRYVTDVVSRHGNIVGKMRDMVPFVMEGSRPTRDQIIAHVGMRPGGGSNNYVYELRKRGIIVKTDSGGFIINPVLSAA